MNKNKFGSMDYLVYFYQMKFTLSSIKRLTFNDNAPFQRYEITFLSTVCASELVLQITDKDSLLKEINKAYYEHPFHEFQFTV